MDKSPEAFRTISEVAEFLDTPAHVLRFWESRFPQIRPVKRAGGRRYYRPGDVALLAGIKKLLHDDGITIRGVQKILREQGIRHVSGLASTDVVTMLDDSNIEAVLSAEYGPRERAEEGGPYSPEALQSAQIISLETALNRQDVGRNTAPSQAELWPPAPPEEPSEASDAEAWPGDPGDPVPVEADGFDMEPPQSASDNVAKIAAHVDAGTPPPMTTNGALIEQVDLPADDAGQAATSEPEAADDAAATGAVTDSQSGIAKAEEDAVGAGSASTVAALLRQVSPDQTLAAQADLIRLRDRLIDLRGRVSEAARRRAK